MNSRSPHILAAAVLLWASVAHADSDEITDGVGVGLGAASVSEGSSDYQPVASPGSKLNWRLHLGEPGAGPGVGGLQRRTNVAPLRSFDGGSLFNDRSGRSGVDNSGIDGAFGAEAFAEYSIDNGDRPGAAVGFNFELARDVSVVNDGLRLSPEVYYRAPLGDSWELGANVTSSYAAPNPMGASFGMGSSSAARTGVKEVDGNAGFKDVGIGVGVTYNLAPSWNIDSALRYKRSLGDGEDNPVSEDEGATNQLFGGVMVRFKF